MFLGGNLDLETEGNWYKMTRVVAVQNRLIFAADLLKTDRRIASRMMAESLTIP
jgi:hypothetical protein